MKKKSLKIILNDFFYFILVFVLLFVSWFSYSRINGLIASSDLVIHTNLVKLKMEQTLSSLKDAETEQRGFIITKDSTFLKPFKEATKNTYLFIKQVDSLTFDNPVQQQRIKKVNLLVKNRFDHLIYVLSLKNLDSKTLKMQMLEGKTMMDSLRVLIEEMSLTEDRILRERIKERDSNVIITPLSSLIVVIFILLFVIYSYIKIRKDKIRLIRLNKDAGKHEIELTEKNLELERKNAELSSFSYITSHDLQEPLRTITNFSELLRKKYKGQLDKNGDEYLGYLISATGRMQALIKDLLDYSIIGRNKKLIAIDCNSLVQEVLSDLDLSIKESNVEITIDKLPTLDGYSELKLLFQNLISNAIKYRKKDEKLKIDISVSNKRKGWIFAVKDNGIGIDKQYRERIFIIFQKLHSRTQYAGTGIGLAHCKKIAELHGGRIWVKSELDKGSTFYFTIAKLIK